VTSEQLSVVGVNFRKTSLEIRSKFALTPEHAKFIYLDAIEPIYGNFFILSTCNRTEIYATGIPTELLIDLLSKHSGLSAVDVHHYAFTKSGNAAVQHLFRVASGLDSQILGDYEIIGQLKKAFALARECNKANGFLEKLVNAALQASKQIKSKTSISNGTTSVSYAVIQLLKQTAGSKGSLHICLVGLGKIGMLTLKNLKHYLPNNQITLVNRNQAKAEEAAVNQETAFAPFNDLKDIMRTSNVLIVATGADHAIIHKNDVATTGINLIFDLAVPSNVNNNVRELPGVQLFNIDQLSQIVNQSVEARKNEIPLAEAIIAEHILGFKQWETRRGLYSTKLSPYPVI
jgi:glutamyl-tRNA reductase